MPDATPNAASTPVVPVPIQPAPTPAPEPATPDALLIPESMRRGATQLDRIDSICSFAEPILGGDRSKGVTAIIRRQPGRKMFVTLDPLDTLRFPVTSGKSGSRYYWTTQPNGVEYGYLVDAAKKETTSA